MFGGKITAPALLNEETLDTRTYMYVVILLVGTIAKLVAVQGCGRRGSNISRR